VGEVRTVRHGKRSMMEWVPSAGDFAMPLPLWMVLAFWRLIFALPDVA